MKVLGETLVADFSRRHAYARKPLSRFLEVVRAATWRHMADVKATMSTTDFDPGAQTYIFDVGGNKYRVLAAIDFEEQTLIIESVMTHEKYDRR